MAKSTHDDFEAVEPSTLRPVPVSDALLSGGSPQGLPLDKIECPPCRSATTEQRSEYSGDAVDALTQQMEGLR